ncbi:MAG: serine hydrolase [Bacteroidia bacterium]|nr:serine hydrolase [Bacteroidia bacterium]
MRIKVILGLCLFSIIILLLYPCIGTSQKNNNIFNTKTNPPYLEITDVWVDSVFSKMTPDERLGQLFMVAAYSNHGNAHVEELSHIIKEYKIGGLIFLQGNPVNQAKLTNYYQSESKIPLFIAMDAEWGPAMQLDSLTKFPYHMALGAIQDDSMLYEFGCEVARQLKLLGVHINFAPVLDINNNPLNPVISVRSFGEDKIQVARKGYAYMSGLQDNNIIAVGKHFPGHGDTDKDSHKALPVISHSWERLDTLELYPFKELIKRGIGGIMLGHLYIPALDTTQNTPSSLSRSVVSDLLKDELGFDGLTFTDAMTMDGIAKYYNPGEAETNALRAGNDIIVMPSDIQKTFKKIKEAINKGEISQNEIDRHCKKILNAKYWAGLNKYKPVDTKNIKKDINTPLSEVLNRKLIESSFTLIKNDSNIVPFDNLEKVKIAVVNINNGEPDIFTETLNLYGRQDRFSLPRNISDNRFIAIKNTLAGYDLVIISIYSQKRASYGDFDIPMNVFSFIDSLAYHTKIVLCVFANPYCLRFLQNITNIPVILMAYEDTELHRNLAAQLLYGGIAVNGKCPVTICKQIPKCAGISVAQPVRLKYSIPEELGINSEDLTAIDSIVIDAINEKAMPGCQILVAGNGTVFYYKSFGYHTYNKTVPVKNTDMYDLASVTKIVATMPALMRLYEEKKFDLNAKITKYMPELENFNKKELKIKDILTHQAQLTPWIPFWIKTVSDSSIYNTIYSKTLSEKYSIKVAENLYIIKEYKDSIYARIVESNLLKKKEYKYSDIGFYWFQKIIENITGECLEKYVSENFYKPLGMISLGYKPLERFGKSSIVPTEDDKKFRMQLLQGYVHDPGAAMLGGVAGHAGVFANANDIAKIMQMYLQNGEYGGKRYFQKKKIAGV